MSITELWNKTEKSIRSFRRDTKKQKPGAIAAV